MVVTEMGIWLLSQDSERQSPIGALLEPYGPCADKPRVSRPPGDPGAGLGKTPLASKKGCWDRH